MKFRYTPASASSREWDFDPDKMLTLGEASEVERRCHGMTYDECKMAVLKGAADAKLAFLYVLLRRDNPKVSFDTLRDTTFPGEVAVDYDLDEMVELRAEFVKTLEKGDADDPAAIRAAIEILDSEIEAAGGAPEPEAETEDPKDLAPEPSSETTGGLRSLPNSTSLPMSSTV